jgi:Phage tail tube protein
MAIGSGLSGQVGLKKETTYGTRVASDLFFEFASEGGIRNQNYLESRMIRSGRFFQSAPRRVLTTRDAAVSIAGEVPNKGFGSILDLAHGNTVTPVQQGATTAYIQTHNLTGDPTKSATVQVGKPDTGGTVRPFEYPGSMLNAFTLSCALDGWLEFTAGFDSQDEDTAQTLATASYATALAGFNFQQCVVTVNGVAQNLTTGSLVRSMGLDLSLPRANARFGLRSNATKAKPILNDYTPGSGSIGYEFTDMTQYGLFTAGTKCPIIFAFTSADLAGTAIPFSLTITIASAQFTGTTPQVSGPDILAFEAPFSIMDDGTNPPIKFELMEVRTTAL